MRFPERLVTLAHSLGNVPRKLGALLADSQMGALGPLGSTNSSEMIASPQESMLPPPLRPLGPHMGGQRQKDSVRLLGSEPQFMMYRLFVPPNDPPVTVGFSRGDLAEYREVCRELGGQGCTRTSPLPSCEALKIHIPLEPQVPSWP